MANGSNNNLGGGRTLDLNRLLSERRQLLVDPGSNRGSLDQNWRRIERVSHSSNNQMANLPHWERNALQDSLASHSPERIDKVLGKPAISKAAGDAVDLSKIMGGVGGDKPFRRWNEADPEYPDEEDQPQQNQPGWSDQPEEETADGGDEEQSEQQQQDDGRTPEEEPEEEVADDGGENENEKPVESEDDPNEPKPEDGGEPPMGADADAKPPKGEGAASEGVADAAKTTKGLGEASEVAEGAGALAEGAGAAGAAAAGAAGAEAAAAGTAAASVVVVESNPVGWVLTIAAVLAIFILAIVGLTAMEYAYPSPAEAIVPPTPSLPTGNAAGLMAKACYFKNNPVEYKKVKSNGWTDCWGFVGTSLRYGADSDFRKTGQAKQGPTVIKAHDSAKYSVFAFTSTRQLKPGDMLFVTKNGDSHAGLYIGRNYCGCGSKTTLQASLNPDNYELPVHSDGHHEPMCDNFANRWDTVVRIVK